jgi:hypothetical protein
VSGDVVQVPLTQGRVAVIDAADAEEILKHKWCAVKARGVWYAARVLPRPGRRLVYMHRQILGLQNGDPGVDHRDSDGLNNRRKNLRSATTAQQAMNVRAHRDRVSSRFKGVYWSKRPTYRAGGVWQAVIRVRGKLITWHAKTEVEAARKYNELARRHFGEFARVNEGV